MHLTGQAAAEWGETAYEATIQLITGRTHQIRAQLAAVGCPLKGDLLYAALALHKQQQQHNNELQQAGVSSCDGADCNVKQTMQAAGQQQVPDRSMVIAPSEQCSDRVSALHAAGNSMDCQPQQQSSNDHAASCSSDTALHRPETATAVDAELALDSSMTTPSGGTHDVTWSRAAQEDPLRPIGLQAYKLEILDSEGRLGIYDLTAHDTVIGALGQGDAISPQTQQPVHKACVSPRHDIGCSNCSDSVTAAWVTFQARTPWWRAE